MHVSKSHPLAGETVDVRRFDFRGGVVAARIADPQVIGQQDHDIRTRRDSLLSIFLDLRPACESRDDKQRCNGPKEAARGRMESNTAPPFSD